MCRQLKDDGSKETNDDATVMMLATTRRSMKSTYAHCATAMGDSTESEECLDSERKEILKISASAMQATTARILVAMKMSTAGRTTIYR
jgi:hypothetical protein